MEKLILQEQDLINAVCLFHAKFKETQPENVEVELCYDDEVGYTAEAYYNGAMDKYKQAHFITAIRLYIDEQLNKDSMAARITLDIDDELGMIANVEW